MAYEHVHTYCELFYPRSGTCTYTVNKAQWHLEAGDIFIVAPGSPHSTRYEGKTSCERIIVFCTPEVILPLLPEAAEELRGVLERSGKVILNADSRRAVDAMISNMLLEMACPSAFRRISSSWNRCTCCCFCCAMASSAMKPCPTRRATAPILSAR